MKKNMKIALTMLLIGNLAYSRVMEIDEVVNLSLENNLQIKLAKNEITINESKKGQTKSLYLPKITLSGGVVHLNEMPDIVKVARKLGEMNNGLDDVLDLLLMNETKLSATPGVDPVSDAIATALLPYYTKAANGVNKVELEDDGLNYSSVKLALQQPLYTGGKITAVNKQVDILTDISQLEKKKAINDTTFETKKAYSNVVLAKRSLRTATEIYNGIQKHVEEAQSYYKAGLIPELDVVRAKAKLSEVRQKVVQAENAVNVATEYLSFVIGIDLPKDFEPNIDIVFDEASDNLENLKKLALDKRVELKIYDDKLQLAKENKKVIASQKKPVIAIQGEYKYEGTDLSKEDAKWQIGIVGSWSAYDGGSINSQIDEADATIAKATNGKQLVENSIKIDVTKSYLDMMNAIESIRVAEVSIKQATEVQKMAEATYQAGFGNSLERLDAELYLEQAKNSYDNAVNQYVISKYNLEKAIGQYY